VKANPAAEEGGDNMTYRPESFDGYIGQEPAKNMLRSVVENSIANDVVIPHVMLIGNAGLGKTTLAKVVAKASELDFIGIIGADIDEQFLQKLATAYRTLLFIDEIHTIPRKLIEYFYTMLEDRKITVNLEKDDSKPVELPVPTLTVIGATTEVGLLPKPLRDRFPLTINLVDYTKENITEIVKRHPACSDGSIGQEAREEIIKRSRNVPRLAISAITGLKAIYPKGNISKDMTLAYFGSSGIDEEGLNFLNHKVLKILGERYPGAVGIHTLSALAEENKQTLIAEERYLCKKGLIELTASGRVITKKGLEYLDKEKETH